MSALARMFAAPPRPVDTLLEGCEEDFTDVAVGTLARGADFLVDEEVGLTLNMLPAPPRPVCM